MLFMILGKFDIHLQPRVYSEWNSLETEIGIAGVIFDGISNQTVGEIVL